MVIELYSTLTSLIKNLSKSIPLNTTIFVLAVEEKEIFNKRLMAKGETSKKNYD